MNLDGESGIIHEVKTYGGEFKITKSIWQQAQVEMFAAKKPLEIVAYKLMPEDYGNYFNPIDPDRISRFAVKYDPDWIGNEYIPRLKYLARCLKRHETPRLEDL